jgi:hypothetical protein
MVWVSVSQPPSCGPVPGSGPRLIRNKWSLYRAAVSQSLSTTGLANADTKHLDNFGVENSR